MVRPLPKLEPDVGIRAFLGPRRIAASILGYLFPPATFLTIAAHLTPLFVALSLIPLILILSLFSGWYIWKTIPVAWRAPIYLQYGDGTSPYADLSLPTLSTTQPYDVALQLVLPASEANLALGNFMATLSLSTPSNKTLLTVSRPAIALPPKPVAFPFSSVPRFIDMDVPLLSAYVPETSKMNARINLGRRDSWKSIGDGQGRELSVYDAALKGTVRPRGIRGLVSRFPLIFALVAFSSFFSLSIITLAACILPAVRWRTSLDETPVGATSREDRPVRIRKRSRKSTVGESRPASAVDKFEDIPVGIPSTVGSGDFSLKRRRSRMSDVFLDSEN